MSDDEIGTLDGEPVAVPAPKPNKDDDVRLELVKTLAKDVEELKEIANPIPKIAILIGLKLEALAQIMRDYFKGALATAMSAIGLDVTVKKLLGDE